MGLAMKFEIFDDVLDAIAKSPEDAANKKLRYELMHSIVREVKSWGVSQGVAAKRLGITRARLNMLLKGRMGSFSLDALMGLAEAGGVQVDS